MKKRDANVDLIRVLACLSVIGLHVNTISSGSADFSKVLWRLVFADGVAFFFIVMGFFLFQNESFGKLLKKTGVKIFIPAFIVMALSKLFYPWIMHQASFFECFQITKEDIVELFTCILNWSAGDFMADHLWYLFVYAQVLLLFPILKLLCPGIHRTEENAKTLKYRLYLITFTFLMMVIEDIQAIEVLPIHIGCIFPILIPAVYAVAGYTIYENREKIKRDFRIPLVAGIVFILVQILRFLMEYQLIGAGSEASFLNWKNSFAFVATVCMIIVLLAIPLKENRFSSAICFLGSLNYSIYLVHYGLYAILQWRGLQDRVAEFVGSDSPTLLDSTALQEILFLGIRIIVVFTVSFAVSLTVYFIKKGLRTVKKRYPIKTREQ